MARSTLLWLWLAIGGCSASAAEMPSGDEPISRPPAPAAPGSSPTPPADAGRLPGSSPTEEKGPRVFPVPRKGAHVVVKADAAALGCSLLVDERSYDFPAGFDDAQVSSSGKGMCAHDATTIHCHVSGTETGFCHDALNNLANLLTAPPTLDGDFVIAYAKKYPTLRINVSGHSQGAYDASRVAPLLRKGDQLILLQPASAALSPNDPLLAASKAGAYVYVAWSPNDDASLGIRGLAGDIPLLQFPLQTGIRVHNAPNARDLFLRLFAIPDGLTMNPVLDASILSNPGSPHDAAWRFPSWQ